MIFSKIKILKHKLKNSELPILQVAYFLFFEKVVNNNGQQFMSKESLLRNIIGIILTPFLYLLIIYNYQHPFAIISAMFNVKENNKFILDYFMFIPFIVKPAMIFFFVLMTIMLTKNATLQKAIISTWTNIRLRLTKTKIELDEIEKLQNHINQLKTSTNKIGKNEHIKLENNIEINYLKDKLSTKMRNK